MRDRLIEDIKNSLKRHIGESCWLAKNIADDLIADGWMRPPCKVGDKVWFLPCYGGNPMGMVMEDKVQMIGITSRGVHIKLRNHHDHNKMHMLGKTVFLSREEAEKALKGGDGE